MPSNRVVAKNKKGNWPNNGRVIAAIWPNGGRTAAHGGLTTADGRRTAAHGTAMVTMTGGQRWTDILLQNLKRSQEAKEKRKAKIK